MRHLSLIGYLKIASTKDLKRVYRSDKAYMYGDISVFNAGIVVKLRVSDKYKPHSPKTWNGYDFVYENDSVTKGYIETILTEKGIEL